MEGCRFFCPSWFLKESRLSCHFPALLWFIEKAGCLPYLIMIWNKDADCPTLLGFVEEKEIYCFGITKEFFYRGRTRVDTYTVDNEGRKKRQRQLLLKRCIFYDRNHGGGYSLMWKRIIVFDRQVFIGGTDVTENKKLSTNVTQNHFTGWTKILEAAVQVLQVINASLYISISLGDTLFAEEDNENFSPWSY